MTELVDSGLLHLRGRGRGVTAEACERAVTKKKTHNFDLALPEHYAEQAVDMPKSSYCLEFLELRRAVREGELEDRLVALQQTFL